MPWPDDDAGWAELEIRWEKDKARFRTDAGAWHELPCVFPTRNGISYLHLQSAAKEADPSGVLIEYVKAVAADESGGGTAFPHR